MEESIKKRRENRLQTDEQRKEIISSKTQAETSNDFLADILPRIANMMKDRPTTS